MKTLLKNFIISAFASRPINLLADKLLPTGIPVFMFHRFTSIENNVRGHDPDYLEKCLKYLTKQNYNFVSLEQIIHSITNKQPLPKRSIAFTMDDGFLDQATVAAPIFIKYKCPVTIFLISGMLDEKLWPWDDQLSYLIHNTKQHNISLTLSKQTEHFSLENTNSRKSAINKIQNWMKMLDANHTGQYIKILSEVTAVPLPLTAPDNYKAMTWDMARKLEKQGIKFAPHTDSHRILSKLSNTDSKLEIFHSWQRLREELISPSPVFCYPTGRAEDFSLREIEYIKEAGLIGAVSTEATFISPGNNDSDYIYKLPRFGLPDSFTDFIQYSGWIERAKTKLLNR